jgi:hypothetical protein
VGGAVVAAAVRLAALDHPEPAAQGRTALHGDRRPAGAGHRAPARAGAAAPSAAGDPGRHAALGRAAREPALRGEPGAVADRPDRPGPGPAGD